MRGKFIVFFLICLLSTLLIANVTNGIATSDENPLYAYNINPEKPGAKRVPHSIRDDYLPFANISLTPHTPIFIDDNSDFNTLGFNGSGTSGDPYLIENFFFNSSSAPLISIQNTTVHFTIRNNLLDGINGSFYGVYLENVTHGWVDNNEIYNTWVGIWLNTSLESRTIISNNLVHHNYYHGIRVWSSSNVTVPKNRVYENVGHGIVVYRSTDTILFNNEVYNNSYFGIYLLEADQNWINENIVYNNDFDGLVLIDANKNTLSNNKASSNTINGIYAYYSNDNDISFNHVYDNLRNGIYLNASTNNLVSNNEVFSNSRHGIVTDFSIGNMIFENKVSNTLTYDGIHVYFSESILVCNNTVYNCSFNGIRLFNTFYSEVSHNVVYGNINSGILSYRSQSNIISRNVIYKNSIIGLYFDYESENNIVYWNDFLNNNINESSQAYDHGFNNTIRYNFWADWIGSDANHDGVGDSPYLIEGTAENSDPHPLLYPVNPSLIPDSVLSYPTVITVTTIPPIINRGTWKLIPLFLIGYVIVGYIGSAIAITIYYFRKRD